jgi:phosphate-selective porin
MPQHRSSFFVAIAMVVACAGTGAQAQNLEERIRRLEDLMGAEVDADDFRVFWKDGLRFETRDARFRLEFGGRIQTDFALISEDRETRREIGKQEDAAEIRRAQIFARGRIHDRVTFRVQYDFRGGETRFNEVSLGLEGLPLLGTLKIGHIKEPFSLERVTSAKYITFLERALPAALVPGRNTGLLAANTLAEERMTWSLGAFADTDDFGNGTLESNSAVTARVTALPVHEEEGRALVHLGAAYSHRHNPDDLVRYRSRPEIHTADFFVDTGGFRVGPGQSSRARGRGGPRPGLSARRGRAGRRPCRGRHPGRSDVRCLLRVRELLPHRRAPSL